MSDDWKLVCKVEDIEMEDLIRSTMMIKPFVYID